MSSLNADNTDDIENGPIEDDIVKPPPVVTSSQRSVMITVPTDAATHSADAVDEELVKKLPTSNVSFKLVSDKVSRVVELQDVESAIMSQESMSRNSAELVQSVYGDFLSPKLRLNEFTAVGSKTNYAYCRKYMAQRIATEQADAVSNYATFIDQSLTDTKCVIDKLKQVYLPAIIDAIELLKENASNSIQKISTCKDLIIEFNGGYVNIADIDIQLLIPQHFTDQRSTLSEIGSILKNLKKVLTCPMFKTYLHACAEGVNLNDLLSIEKQLDYKDKPLTLKTLSMFYDNRVVLASLLEFTSIVNSCEAVLEKIRHDAETQEKTYSGLSQVIVAHTEEIQTLFEKVTGITKIAHALLLFNPNAERLLELFTKA